MKTTVEVDRVDNDVIVKWLRDAVPLGPHPTPYSEFVLVRLANIVAAADAIDAFDDDKEWIEKGLAEWREVAVRNARQAESARATARVAIAHLQAVLNKPRTHYEQQKADTAARDWLLSIGSEPQ